MNTTRGALFAALSLLSCRSDMAAKKSAATDIARKAMNFPLPELRPTSAALALRNLDGVIADRPALSAHDDLHARYVQSLILRGHALGISGDLIEALRYAQTWSAATGTRAARLSLVDALAALHRFDEAAELVAPLTDVAPARLASLMWARGIAPDLTPLAASREPAVHLLRADVLERTDPVAASAAVTRAIALLRDVSPFAAATASFEVGRFLQQRGDAHEARAWLLRALEYLPQHAHAATHVAALVSPTEALAHLARLDPRSDDPDVIVARARAQALLGLPMLEEIERAEAKYTALLAVQPAAYAEHAAGFFLDVNGQHGLAAQWARLASQVAPTEASHLLWLRAAPKEACDIAARAAQVASIRASVRQTIANACTVR